MAAFEKVKLSIKSYKYHSLTLLVEALQKKKNIYIYILIYINKYYVCMVCMYEILGWFPAGPVLPQGEKVLLYWLATLLVMVSQ